MTGILRGWVCGGVYCGWGDVELEIAVRGKMFNQFCNEFVFIPTHYVK